MVVIKAAVTDASNLEHDDDDVNILNNNSWVGCSWVLS